MNDSGQVQGKIYRLCGWCLALVAGAFIIPRFFANPEGGFAAGAGAVLAFLAILAAALLLSLYLLGLTAQSWGGLAPPAKVAGVAPVILLGAALIVLMSMLRY